jgi:hypothetical protein
MMKSHVGLNNQILVLSGGLTREIEEKENQFRER